MMHDIIEITGHLNQFENNDRLREVIVQMKSKFIKYWGIIPVLYSYAFILDPRAKLNGFTKALQIMSRILNRDYYAYFQNVKIELVVCFPIMSLNMVESGYRGKHNLTKEEVWYLHRIYYLVCQKSHHNLLLLLHLYYLWVLNYKQI
jgi:hypothetical protein